MALAATASYSGVADPAWLRAVIMAGVFILVAPVCNGIWLFAGNVLRLWLNNPTFQRLSLLTMVILLWGSALVIAVT